MKAKFRNVFVDLEVTEPEQKFKMDTNKRKMFRYRTTFE
jgi:hypothetical protein